MLLTRKKAARRTYVSTRKLGVFPVLMALGNSRFQCVTNQHDET